MLPTLSGYKYCRANGSAIALMHRSTTQSGSPPQKHHSHAAPHLSGASAAANLNMAGASPMAMTGELR